MAEDELQPFQPSTVAGRMDNLYSTFHAGRIDPDSPRSRDAWGDDRQWLTDQRKRSEHWNTRKAQMVGGAVVALISAALSVLMPWLIHLMTIGKV